MKELGVNQDLQSQIEQSLKDIEQRMSSKAFVFFLENNLYQYYEHLLRTPTYGLMEDQCEIMQVKLDVVEYCYQHKLVAPEELQSALREILVETQSYMRNGSNEKLLQHTTEMHEKGRGLLKLL